MDELVLNIISIKIGSALVLGSIAGWAVIVLAFLENASQPGFLERWGERWRRKEQAPMVQE